MVDKKDGFDETFPLKVSSIAELKKALRDDLEKICLDLLAQGLDGHKPLRYVKKLADSYSKKIDSLSAGVRERIELLSHDKTSENVNNTDCVRLIPWMGYQPDCTNCNPFTCEFFGQAFREKMLEELRRVLGVEK